MRRIGVSVLFGLIVLLFLAHTMVAQATATVARNANLRAGPGTNYAVVGGLKAGAAVTIVGSNATGDWYQLDGGQWIAAFLVKGVTGDVPTVVPSATITTTVGVTKTPTTNPTLPMTTTPVSPTATLTQVPPTPIPPTATPTQAARQCDPSYPTLCIPPGAPDLDCGDVGVKNFTVLPPDPHRFDRDKDGVGCES